MSRRPPSRHARPGHPLAFAWLLLAWLALALAGCGPYPRDPQRTTERVEGGTLRVGVIHDPPFVDLRDAGGSGRLAPHGREVRMARALADSLDARVSWVDGGAGELFEELEHFRLDMVIGGVSAQSPWRQRVALGLPYPIRDAEGRLVRRVSALPPGENRWQMRVERFQRSPAGRAILRGTGAPATEARR